MRTSCILKTRRRSLEAARAVVSVAVPLLVLPAGCWVAPADDATINPFRDLPAIALDGEPRELPFTIAPLGVTLPSVVLKVTVPEARTTPLVVSVTSVVIVAVLVPFAPILWGATLTRSVIPRTETCTR